MKKQIILFLILIFSLNLVWEVSHSMLYNWNIFPLENNIYYYIPKILYSTLGDLILTILIFAIISIKNNNITWINKPTNLDYLIIILLGLIISILIELRALNQNLWTYSNLMPTLFGIGISPLLQLTIISIICLLLTKNIRN